MTDRPIYFDYMATTPVDPSVIDVMLKYLGPTGEFGNPASTTHVYGLNAALAVDNARASIADLLNASPDEIIFTSGATEANNLGIIGAALFYQNKGRHVITMTTEHKAVLESFAHLETLGFEVTYLAPEPDGLLSLDALKAAIRKDTILVSVMFANNEIGVIQDIAAIGQCVKQHGIIFHVDAAQAVGKLPIDLQQLPVDLLAISSHKCYGPKGMGALYVRQKPKIRLLHQTFGGSQERGLRAGTLATHQIAGLGHACLIAKQVMTEESARILALRTRLWAGIKDLPNVWFNGHPEKRLAGNLNITLSGIDGESLKLALNALALSTSSACASASVKPSYVLRAIGLSEADALSSLRLSFGRFTTVDEIDKAIALFNEQIPRLQAMSPR